MATTKVVVQDLGDGAPKRYVEDGVTQIGIQSFLPTDVYGAAITAFVIVCADTMLINRRRKTVYLARRSVRPMMGWWIIGGRMLAGESEVECVQRTFHRETSLLLPLKRFKYVTLNRYWWKDREQEPYNMGSDNLAYTFVLCPTAKELEFISAHLEPREYDPSVGLVEFTRDQLVAEGVHQVIIDMYDEVFMPLADRFRRFALKIKRDGLSVEDMLNIVRQAFGK